MRFKLKYSLIFLLTLQGCQGVDKQKQESLAAVARLDQKRGVVIAAPEPTKQWSAQDQLLSSALGHLDDSDKMVQATQKTLEVLVEEQPEELKTLIEEPLAEYAPTEIVEIKQEAEEALLASEQALLTSQQQPTAEMLENPTLVQSPISEDLPVVDKSKLPIQNLKAEFFKYYPTQELNTYLLQRHEAYLETLLTGLVNNSKDYEIKIYKTTGSETLQFISRQLYGTTRRWTEIYALNHKIIQNWDKIEPGTLLKVIIKK